MLREQLKKFFINYEPAIRQIIDEVGELEQMNISKQKPHLNDQIDEIVERISKQQLQRQNTDTSEG